MLISRRRRYCLLLALITSLTMLVLTLFMMWPPDTPFQDGVKTVTLREASQNANLSEQAEHPHRITCVVDDRQMVPCLAQGHDHFLPFTAYLQKRFDLTGLAGKKYFHLHTSFAKIRTPPWNDSSYDPRGPFEQFNDVALRPRVRCVDPITGVPMSTQWSSRPYFYPIQILQFGLEHFNKHINGTVPIVQHSLTHRLQRFSHRQKNGAESNEDADQQFELAEDDSVHVDLRPDLPVLLLTLATLTASAGFTVEMQADGDGDHPRRRTIELHFRHSAQQDCVWRERELSSSTAMAFVYSLGAASTLTPIDLVLDLPIYASKALATLCVSKEADAEEECRVWRGATLVPHGLRVQGACRIRAQSLRQQNSAHREQFTQVTRWLLTHQDAAGGWPASVRRTIVEGRHKLTLPAGWHSAMAQGLALSFLTRVYAHAHASSDADGVKRIRQAAERALTLFNMPASDGGVRAHLFDQPWFEEYPTVPLGNYVLNGFIYALVGLYDFGQWDTGDARVASNTSRALFREGVHALRTLLPLYDTGARSLYDLRHVRLGCKPNVARWDYHSVHVFQLWWMHSITGDPMFAEFAQRWGGYARGVVGRAQHN